MRKRGVRNSAIGVAAVLLVYTLAGFFLAPYLLEQQLVKYVKEELGAQASIEKIIINPYTLALTIDNFSLRQPDRPRLIGFKQFHANFELASVANKAWTFQKVRLAQPFLRLQISKNGQLNLAQLLPPAETPPPEESPGPVPLIIDQIIIAEGQVQFVDQSQPIPFKKSLEAINVELGEFSTLPGQGGDYAVKAVTKSGETLRWRGEITLNPLHSQGHFELVGGRARTPWQYLREQVAFEIASGWIDASTDYTLDSRRGPLQFTLTGARLALFQLGLRSKGGKGILAVPRVGFSGAQLQWPEKVIKIEQIHMTGAKLSAWLNPQGKLNWQELLATEAAKKEETASVTDTSSPDWRITVNELSLKDIDAIFQDRTTEPPVTVDIDSLGLQLTNISSAPGSKSDFILQFDLNRQSQLAAQGALSAFPPSIDAKIYLSPLPLSPFQPYLNPFLKMELASGEIEIRGNIEYAQKSNTPNFRFSGFVAAQNFSAEDPLLGERFLGWDGLKADEIRVELPPLRIQTGAIELDAPYGKVVINEDQKMNVKEVLSPLTAKSERGRQAAPKSESAPVSVSIDSILIKEAAADFADWSVSPKFSMGLHSLEGEIQNISSTVQGGASISLEGTIEPYGAVGVTGKADLFALGRATELNALLRNIALSELTPYAMKFVGHAIEEGKLSLDLDYQIKEDRLQGENEILLDNLQLGEEVNSPEAIDAPIGLAIALLKDSQGEIEIHLPIEGNLDSPQFSYGHLIGEALTGIVGKVVSSPFRLLANLVGGEELDLGFVEFRPASSELPPPAQEKLLQLATALKKRPALQLQIQGQYDPMADAKALKKDKFEARLSARLKLEESAALTQQQVLEQLYLEQFSNNALNQKRSQYGLEAAGAEAGEGDASSEVSSYQQALQEQLIEAQAISEKELKQLGQARAAAIQKYLAKQGGISEERMGFLQIEAVQTSGQEFIRCQLDLS